jgi:hypothetical protein
VQAVTNEAALAMYEAALDKLYAGCIDEIPGPFERWLIAEIRWLREQVAR